MFGAFKPSAPLSGGLLWKIPWRLSSPRKLRHRRRLRRVDNVVSVLDSALKRSGGGAAISTQSSATTASNPSPQEQPSTSDLSARRHGRGPLQGDFVPSTTTITAHNAPDIHLQQPSSKLLRAAAAESKTIKLIERWKTEMPTEREMLPRDKYTMFDKKVRGYRKGVHKLPKWTRVSQRLNPPGF